MPPSFIYNTHSNQKKIASLLHMYIHAEPSIVEAMLQGLTEIDKVLYSEETLHLLRTNIEVSGEGGERKEILLTQLQNEESAREYVYRFFLKGSNVINILMHYIKKMYKNEINKFPNMFYSDWDTTILINPDLSSTHYTILFQTILPIIQKQLIILSQKLSIIPYFHTRIQTCLDFTKNFIDENNNYIEYRKYPITYEKEQEQQIHIHDPSIKNSETKSYIESLGTAGKGLRVTSNLRGGLSKKNTTSQPNFYLGRIMIPIRASRTIWLPVEILDISMNYQNDDLRFAWESHSEYHIQDGTIDFRVISPTSLYFDLQKCLLNAERSNNQTRRNKVPARLNRIKQILNTMIVPYHNKDAIMRANLERHSISGTLVGNLRRKLQNNITRKKEREIEGITYEDS